MEQQTTGTVSSNDSAQPSNVADGQQPTNGTAAQDMAQAPALQPKNNKKKKLDYRNDCHFATYYRWRIVLYNFEQCRIARGNGIRSARKQ